MISLWMIYAITVSLLFGLAALLVERVLRWYRRPARGVWGVAIAASLLLPAVLILLPAPPAPPLAELSEAGAAQGGVEVGIGALRFLPEPSSYAVVGAEWTRFDGPLLGVWLFGSGLLVALLAGSALWIRARRKGWRQQMVEGRQVLLSQELGPAVVGLRRPVIVLPEWVLDLESRAVDLVLAHEEEHVAARDTVLLCAALLAVVLVPWSLPLWWHFRRLRLAVECDCDRRVLGRGVQWNEYGALLLAVGQRMRRVGPPATALAESPTLLERRLTMMNAIIPKRRRAKTLVALGAGVFVIALACEAPIPTAEDDGARDALQGAGAELRDLPPAPPELTIPPSISTHELAREPVFVPHTATPEVRNREDVMRALVQEYPQELRDAGIGGVALVHFFVEEDGRVGNALIQEGSGHAGLDEAALRVASVFEFEPARNRDEPVAVWVSIPIRFTTTRGDATASERTVLEGNVRIRGSASAGSGEQPLIFVDGELVGEGTSVDELEDLDPDDIERIEIVKGAAAVDGYGPRAVNGVILITRK